MDILDNNNNGLFLGPFKKLNSFQDVEDTSFFDFNTKAFMIQA